MTKTAAVALLVGIPVSYLVRKQRRCAWLFAAGMLPFVVGWALWVAAHRSLSNDPATQYYTNYLGFHLASFAWRDVPVLLWRNVTGLFLGVGGLQVYGMGCESWMNGLRALLTLLSIAGLWRALRRDGATCCGWFLAAFVALLLIWQVGGWDSYERMLLPLLPMLMTGLAAGVAGVWTWLRESFRETSLRTVVALPVAAALAWAILVTGVSGVAVLAQIPPDIEHNRARAAERGEMFQWMKQNLPADAKVLSSIDTLVYLHTGLRGCSRIVPLNLLYRRDRAELVRWSGMVTEYMRSLGLRYLIVGRGRIDADTLEQEASASMQAAAKRSPQLRLVFESSSTSIYELVPVTESTSCGLRGAGVAASVGGRVKA